MMSSPKPTLGTMFFLLIMFSITSFKLSYCFRNNSINFCPEIEKQSLLNFKQSLQDPSNQLSSWNNGEDNCCKWKRVVCNTFTGHVCQLHLRKFRLHGKINASLANLKHLRYLDLSQNDFDETIPSFIGLFPSLEYLNLFDAGFHGTIPPSIGNLSHLHTLDLESFDRSLDVDNLEWLSCLSQLECLNMNYVNLSRAATNWVRVISILSSLVELRFQNCSLNFIAPMNDVVNVSSLAILDLSWNDFQSFVVPKWIFQLSELTYLDLQGSHLQGPIPSNSNAPKLQYIDLSLNEFQSFVVPNWIFQLSKLTHLDLSGNSMEGPIPSIGNTTELQYIGLSDIFLNSMIPDWLYFCKNLEVVVLGNNSLHGTISNAIANLSSLKTLDLHGNKLSGGIPKELGMISSLEGLDLSNNKLTGNLPQSLGELFNLEYLYISHNMLEGVVIESHFANMRKLKYLDASGNHLTLKVHPNWNPPFKLSVLGLGSWNLGGVGTHIPSWIETQKSIDLSLDLSCTGVSGQVPGWFWKILYLNLSHNSLYGRIPNISSLGICLSSNQFSGSLPQVANTTKMLDLSNNSFLGGMHHFFCDMTNEIYGMTILNLEGNQLSGELPDCLMKWPSLFVLNLGYNNMFGSIPNSMGFLAGLMSLNLRNNKLSGQLLVSIHNCTELVKIDLGYNDLDGNIPTWIGTSLPNLRILILQSNKFSGKLSPDICQLNSLQILDLSHNKFSGIILTCVNNFTAMATKRSFAEFSVKKVNSFYIRVGESATISTKGTKLKYDITLSLVTNIDLSDNNFFGGIPKELTSLVELKSLNLSGNHLTGLIPNKIGDMEELESLDLSRNSLSGEIPGSFRVMSYLSLLNLSYNNLTGRIPESTQILGFNASSFIGNSLCGPPLTSNCSNDDEVPSAQLNKEDNEGNKSQIDWFYIFLSLGYAVGFSAICTTLIIKKPWRDAYFGLLEDLWNKLYVNSHIKWRRFTER